MRLKVFTIVFLLSLTLQMYFVSKKLAEKAAWEAAKENNIDFISVIPTLVVGPFIMQTFPPSLITALSLITGTVSIPNKQTNTPFQVFQI